MSTSIPSRRTLVSGFVLLVLGLHLAPVVQQVARPYQTLWPFMAWGMYRSASEPPIETTHWEIRAVTTSGKRIAVESWDVGLGSSAFARRYRKGLAAGDSARAGELAEIVEPVEGEPVTRVVVVGTHYRIDDGDLRVQPTDSLVYSVGDR